jgi:hypothetical protein
MSLNATFQSKHPHTTKFLRITAPANQEPKDLLADLAAAKWTEDSGLGTVNRLPPLDGIQEFIVAKLGTGLFGRWTPEEAVKFETEAAELLRKHGVKGKISYQKLSRTDLI